MTHLAPILLTVLAVLILVCVVGLVLQPVRRRDERQRQRLALVSRPRSKAAAAVGIARASAPERVTPLRRLAGLFGFDPLRCEHHRLPWWAVLGIALAVARGLTFLLSGVAGTALSWALLPVIWVMASRMAFKRWDQQRRSTLLEQLPDALSMIARAVRVGLPVNEAIRAVSLKAAQPTAGEFAKAASAVAVGVPLSEALQAMADHTGIQEYYFFATALGLQSQTGGGLTETLDNLADLVRKRISVKARGYALASEARASSLVLSGLPFVTGAALFLVSPDYFSPMFSEPLGVKMLELAAALLVFGTALMRTIIRKTLA